MKKILMLLALTAGIIFSAAFGAFEVFASRCGEVSSEVLRLHIPANSDSAEDQRIKLELRDHILEKFGGELSSCEDLSAAESKAAELIPEIERECTSFLTEHGFEYAAKAELVTMDFTTREYERLILPAGEYRALRITLGSGEGKNWWCVIFPQLCLPAVSDKAHNPSGEAAENVLESFGTPQKIKVKFAVYEFIEKMLNKQ